MNKKRCEWAETNELERAYHDQEWGLPIFDDEQLFESLVLESLQAGLSWLTILKKRATIRQALDQFDYVKIANYSQEKIDELLGNPGMIRHKLKIQSVIGNAQAFRKIQQEFGSFSHYIWGFVNHQPIINHWNTMRQVPSQTKLSDKISQDMKKRGFKFVGSTTIYAFMQAAGLIDDHIVGCFRKKSNR